VQTEGERQALLERGFAPERVDPARHGPGCAVSAPEATARTRGRRGMSRQRKSSSAIWRTRAARRAASICYARRQWHGVRAGRFRVVLAGPEMPNFLGYWQHYQAKERVVRLGISRHFAEAAIFFAGLDVFALPSRSDSFGIVLLEAWANGVPNVGYRAGGVAGCDPATRAPAC